MRKGMIKRGSANDDEPEDADEDREHERPERIVEEVGECPPGWITRSAVARRIGCSVNRLTRMEQDGELPYVKLNKPPGTHYYDPTDVELMALEEHGQGRVDLLSAAQRIINSQMLHLERVMSMSTESAAKLLQLQSKVVEDLRERNKFLEDQTIGMKEMIGKAESIDFERQITAEGFAADESRKERAFLMVKSMAPALLAVLARRFGGDAGAGAIDPAVKAIISNLTDEQMVRIWESKILTQEQLAALAMLHRSMKVDGKEATAAPAAAPTAKLEAKVDSGAS